MVNNTQLKYMLLFIFLIITFSIYIIQHENVHYQIEKHYGCIDIEYGINSINAYIQCNEYNNITIEQNNERLKLNMYNEIIGYYIPILIMLVFMIILFYMLHNDLKGEKKWF